eukprot:364577-Chlamydomonas_euryale.AAC.6
MDAKVRRRLFLPRAFVDAGRSSSWRQAPVRPFRHTHPNSTQICRNRYDADLPLFNSFVVRAELKIFSKPASSAC